MKIAHISDPHMSSLDNVKWDELLNKRILGYFSWRLKRRHSHSIEILAHTLGDVARRQPDHVIISGDLTHLGTTQECRQAKAWLNNLAAPGCLSIVPGNHDCYVASDFEETIGQWLPYMQGDSNGADVVNPFPYLRTLGTVAIIGLSTAIPTAPFFATGKLGPRQLQALRRLLEATAKRGLYRIIALHHGPQPGMSSYRRRLIDADDLLSIMEDTGAEMIIHGHGHCQVHHMLESGDRLIPIFGVPSASAHYDEPEKRAGYNVYEVNKTPAGWLTHAESFVLDEDGQQFERNFSRVISQTGTSQQSTDQ